MTFDSGGLSLKPSEGMLTMKCDMAGAAAVLGAMKGIAEMGLVANVIGVLACSLQERMQGTTRLRADLRLKQGQHEEAFGRQLEHLGLRIIGDGSI